MPVQLDVGHVLEGAVGREDSLLVLAAEESHLDLLPLVLVRVVLQGSEGSRLPLGCVVGEAVFVATSAAGVVSACCWNSCRVTTRPSPAKDGGGAENQ